MNFRARKNTEQIFPNAVAYPDKNLPSEIFDETNQNYMYQLSRIQMQVKNRLRSHLKLNEKILEDVNFLEGEKTFKNNQNFSSQFMDEDTGLLYGVGFYNFIHKINKDKQEILSQDRSIDILVNKLGYLDMREFLALNRYILEGKNHNDTLVQAKSKFLEDAINVLNKKKRDEIKNKFSLIDNRQELDSFGKTDEKIDFLLNNVSEMKDLFYQNYYKIKEMSFREMEKSLSDFDKYEVLRESAKNEDNDVSTQYNEDNLSFNPKVQLKLNNSTKLNGNNNQDSYIDEIIKKYRDSRTIQIKLNSNDIKKKIDDFIKEKKFHDNSFKSSLRNIFSAIKFYTFFNKYKKMYIPTNMETERLIVNKII